jgi:hypothetical protein
MKILVVFCVAFLSLPIFAQISNRCYYVKVNMNDCFSCLTQLRLLEQYSGNNQTKFVFKREYISDQIQLSQEFINDSTKQSLIFSDSAYTALNGFRATSVTIIGKGGGVLDEFTLRSLPNHLPSLYLNDTTSFHDKLPPTFEPKIIGKRLYLFDRVSSKIELFDLSKGYSVQKMGIKKSMLSDAYRNYFKDSLTFFAKDSMIKAMKVPPYIKLNQFIAFDVKADTVYALMESLYPQVCNYKNKVDTCFFLMYNLVKFVNGKYLNSVCVRNTIEDTTLIYYYKNYLIVGSELSVTDTGLIINISRSKLGEKNFYMGLWTLLNEEFVFKGGLEPDLPKLSYQYSVHYDLNDYIIKETYLMHRFSNSIYRGLGGEEIKLKLKDINDLVVPSDDPYEPKSVNFQITDFMIIDEVVYLLYTLKGKVLYQKFDLAGNSLSESKLLFSFEKSKELFRADPFFLGQDFVVVFPEGKNQMIRIRVK